MNTKIKPAMAQITAEARSRIARGDDPQGLVHILYYPSDSGLEDGIMGLSTALPAGSDLSGYISDYYTLRSLAEA